MKIVIEKELCQPTDGWTVPGPYYHVVRIDEETGEREVLKTFDGDIKEAARYAEHELDIEALAVAWAENPDSFKASAPASLNNAQPIELEAYEGVVTTVNDDYVVIEYKDCVGSDELFFAKAGTYNIGGKVAICVFKQP